jgi:hypothetical protein
MGSPGDGAGTASVGGSMQVQPGLQNSQNSELPLGTIPAKDAGVDARKQRPMCGSSALIIILRALSAWHT